MRDTTQLNWNSLPNLPIIATRPMRSLLSFFLSLLLPLTFLASLTGCSASLVDTVLEDLPIATDIALSVVQIVTSGNASYAKEVSEYAAKVGADLKLVDSLIAQFKSNLAAAPRGVLSQINAALNDAQTNLAAILAAVGVSNPTVTAAVAAAVASVKLILNDAALLIKNNAPAAVAAKLFFGLGIPGVDFLAMVPVDGAGNSAPAGSDKAKVKGSGKRARQLAKEYNAKIAKDFPKATINVPAMHVMGVPVPMTGAK